MSGFLRSLRRAMSRQNILLHDDGISQVSVRPHARLIALVEEDSKLPLWLLVNAKAAATYNCRRPEAAAWDGFIALTAVCTAAEAIVNRLLEPLVSPVEWAGLGKKSLERKPLPEKWVKLSSLLKTTPQFALGAEPIQAFSNVVEARNALVHFKHGQNVRKYEAEMKFRLGGRVPSLDEVVKQPPTKVLQEGIVEPTLNPSLASGYFEAFERLLLPVLDRCPGTAVSDVADRIRQSLAMADEEIAAASASVPGA